MSPKITVHGGATNARADADVSPAADASKPLVGAEADQGRPTPEDEQPTLDDVQDETPQEVAEADTGDDGDPYAGMTLAELRSLASDRGIAAYGTKNQLADRLRESAAPAEDTETP
jgi:hypothetical protein